MELWEVANPVASFSKDASQSSYKRTSTSSDIASEYAKILAEKIANVKTDVREMEEVREQLDEIRELHERLTGEVKVDEDSGNANREGVDASNIQNVETIKRFKPDGSIMVTTYTDGQITEQVKYKPHQTVVADYSAPPKPDGTVATKLEATQNFDLELLLMM